MQLCPVVLCLPTGPYGLTDTAVAAGGNAFVQARLIVGLELGVRLAWVLWDGLCEKLTNQ